jgi:hypothetical protein
MDGVDMRVNESYFLGGFNPNHPSGNVESRLVDNEDGTGTEFTYAEDGSLVSEVERLDLPLPAQEEADIVAVLEAQVTELTTAITAIGTALGTITPTSTSAALRTALLNVRTSINTVLGD